MGRTFNPTSFLTEVPEKVRTWVQSVHKQINGTIEHGTPVKKVPNGFGINTGVYTTFNKANMSGVLIRIAAHGVTGTGAPYNWPAAGGLVINHGLLKQPIGFHVMDVDKDVRIFRTAAPDINQITLQPTDITASVTLYIF
jgi:hypothetical protein